MSDSPNLIDTVRRALGRGDERVTPPAPPELPDPVVRLVHTDLGLPELWMKRAEEMKYDVTPVYVDDLLAQLVAFLRERGLKRIMLPVSPLLEKLNVVQGLRDAGGFDVRRWDEMTLDDAYDFDCGLTDAQYAVAETGSVVIRPNPGHGRAISLVPMVHVVILEPKNFVADLVDLFERLGPELTGSGCLLITGPSKTADIEMNLVQGVHGPGVVKAFVLQ